MTQRRLVVTDKIVGYTWLYNYQFPGNYVEPDPSPDPDRYLAPTYEMDLYSWNETKQKWDLDSSYEVTRFGIKDRNFGEAYDPGMTPQPLYGAMTLKARLALSSSNMRANMGLPVPRMLPRAV